MDGEIDGNGKSPLRISINGGGTASPEEAAAVAAAIERFTGETAAAPTPAGEQGPSGWQRAALIEGVTARQRIFPPDPGSGFPLYG